MVHEKKILIVSGIFPPDVGGPATYVPALAAYLVSKGWNVTVLATIGQRAEPQDPPPYPFRLVLLDRRGWSIVRAYKYISTILRLASRVDLVYVNGLFPAALAASFFSDKFRVCKIVGDWAWERCRGRSEVTDEITTFQGKRYPLGIELLKWFRNRFFLPYAKVILPGSFLKGIVGKWGISPEKIHVVRNGVEVPAFSDLTKKPAQFITVARLLPWKGISEIIAAMASMKDSSLLIIGDGPEKGRIQTQIDSLGLADRISLLGQLSREETLRHVAESQLLFLNSSYEGLPHILLEAGLLQVPVVARANEGTREVFEQGLYGVLIENGTPKEIVEAVASLQTTLHSHRPEVLEKFSSRCMFEQTESLLAAELR